MDSNMSVIWYGIGVGALVVMLARYRTALCSSRLPRLSHTAAAAAIKPMMSTVKDVVDEGLGDDFEETRWVPPTVKRVRSELLFIGLVRDSRSVTLLGTGTFVYK